MNTEAQVLLLFSGYQNALHRMSGHGSLTVLRKAAGEKTSSADIYNSQSVRYTLYSLFSAQRVAVNHVFFSKHLPVSVTTVNCQSRVNQ